MNCRCHANIFLCVCLFLSCCIIPLHGLYDDRIAPKWYMAVVVTAVVAGISAIRMVRRKAAAIIDTKAMSVAAAVALVYNIFCMGIYDVILSAETFPHLPLRGTFDNPAGYALSVCVLTPMAMWHVKELGNKARTAVVFICITAGITAVLSFSRCAILFLAFYWTMIIVGNVRCNKWMKYTAAACVAVMTIVIALSIKQGSTSGRRFILERSFELACKKPLTGYGLHGFEHEYMPLQASFFKNHPNDVAAWLADDTNHPFCEFLYVWVNFGVTGLFGLLAVFIIPAAIYLKTGERRLGMCLTPMAAVVLFALVSYPHLYPMAWFAVILPYCNVLRRTIRTKTAASITVAVCVLALFMCIREMVYENRWHRANEGVRLGYACQAFERYERLYPHYRYSPRFLYSMMFCQYQARRFDKAADTYETLSHMVATYDMELLMGDICLHDGKPGRSLSHYTRAMYMVPVRFAPLDGQLRAYAMMGDTLRADSVARVIMGKRVKVPSAAVEQIRHEAEKALLKEF